MRIGIDRELDLQTEVKIKESRDVWGNKKWIKLRPMPFYA